jgi:hypothetical protein
MPIRFCRLHIVYGTLEAYINAIRWMPARAGMKELVNVGFAGSRVRCKSRDAAHTICRTRTHSAAGLVVWPGNVARLTRRGRSPVALLAGRNRSKGRSVILEVASASRTLPTADAPAYSSASDLHNRSAELWFCHNLNPTCRRAMGTAPTANRKRECSAE